MGNLVCLNCFKTGLEDEEPNQHVQVIVERESDMKMLDDADVVSHFDLQKLQLRYRQHDNNQKRSFYRPKINQELLRSKSMRGMTTLRSARYSLNLKRDIDDPTVVLHRNDAGINPENYMHAYPYSKSSRSTRGVVLKKEPSIRKPIFGDSGDLRVDSAPARRSQTIPDKQDNGLIEKGRKGSILSTSNQKIMEPTEVSLGEVRELDEINGILDSVVASPRKHSENLIMVSAKKKSTMANHRRESPGKQSEESINLKDEEKDKVPDIPLSMAHSRSPRRYGTNSSLKSMSVDKSVYSFKSCNEFDNLTFRSLVSSQSTSKKLSQGKVTKQDLFHEFMFEIEHFGQYFDMTTEMPCEEVIMDRKGAKHKSEKFLATFCPRVFEIECDGPSASLTKRRLVVTRGILVLKVSYRELQVAMNKQYEGPISRCVQKRLHNYGDFDNEIDALMQYSISVGQNTESMKTIRIGTGKKFPRGKQIYYTYEKSVDLHEFFQEKSSIGADPKTGKSKLRSPTDKIFLLKSVQKIEVLNDEHLKVDFYSEYFFPEIFKLSQIKSCARELIKLSIDWSHV